MDTTDLIRKLTRENLELKSAARKVIYFVKYDALRSGLEKAINELEALTKEKPDDRL